MMTKEQRSEFFRALADGKVVETRREGNVNWWTLDPDDTEKLSNVMMYDYEWRIKPEPKPDIVRYMFVEAYPCLDNAYNAPNLKLVYDGETLKLKQAVILE